MGKDAKAQLNKNRKPSDCFAYQKNKKKYTVFCLNTKFIKVVQTTVKEPSSPAEELAQFGIFRQGTYFHPLPEPMTPLSFWRKAKCIAHDPNLQSLSQQKDILVHSPLYTNFAYRLGDGMVWRKNRKAGFLFDFSYRQEHVDAHGSGMKVSKWSKYCSEQAISPGSSFCTSLEPRVVWIKPRLKYITDKVQQWPLTSCFNYSTALHCKCSQS